MAKRYHSGMKKMDAGGYYDARRQEEAGFGMINEDHSAVANLPKDVMIKPYPECPYGMDSSLDDTIRGIDRQIGTDDSVARRHRSKSKY